MAIKSNIPDSMRNQPCPCQSGLKAKHCHADPIKLEACNRVAQIYMMNLIAQERKKRGIDPYKYICEKCGKGTDVPIQSQISKTTLMCPDENCGGTVKINEEFVKWQKEAEEQKQKQETKIILEN